tara:strand:- start:22810 stop:22953 length:144 start_codon:yes stop_codon:yes gene_type:complete
METKPYIENWWGLMANLISGTKTAFTFDTKMGEHSNECYVYRIEKQN